MSLAGLGFVGRSAVVAEVPYSFTRSDGKVRHLNGKQGKNGQTLYFFTSRFREETACAMPEGYVAGEKGHMTFIKRKDA